MLQVWPWHAPRVTVWPPTMPPRFRPKAKARRKAKAKAELEQEAEEAECAIKVFTPKEQVQARGIGRKACLIRRDGVSLNRQVTEHARALELGHELGVTRTE